MKIIGLLCWYEEPASWLAECVASAAKLCDHIIAVDGPYAAFPGALRRPASGSEQADTIARTAAGAGIGATVHVPRVPWWGGEVEKRDWMFKAAGLITTDEDWLFVIDADEALTTVPPDTRQLLEKTDLDVAELRIWSRDGSETMDRRFLRSLPGLSVDGAHYIWSAPTPTGRTVLRGNQSLHDLAPAEPLWDVRLEHRHRERPAARQQAKQDYYAQLPELEHIELFKEEATR